MAVDLKSAPPLDPRDGPLAPYLRALRAHRLLIAVITLCALAGSVAWLALRTPDYRATAQVLVTPVPQDSLAYPGLQILRADANESTRTVQTAAALVDSPRAARITADRLGGGWTSRRVEEAVEVSPQGESNVLSVTATVEGAELAARVATTFARAALDTRAELLRSQVDAAISQLRGRQAPADAGSDAAVELSQQLSQLQAIRTGGDPTLSLSQPATVPPGPVGAPPWLVVVMAVLAGFVVATGAALLLEFLDRRIRDEDELSGVYPLPVLSHIPKLAREFRGRRRRRSILSTPPAIREAFRSLQVQLDRTGEPPRVIMLTSPSAEDGKTTCAVNLAVALVGAGHRVVLMDLDLRKPDVGRSLGVTPKQGLVSLLASDAQLEDLLVQPPEVPPLRVLPAGEDGDFVLLEALGRRLPEMFAEARELADYVIVDTAPLGEVSDALMVVDHADELIVVARPGNTNRTNLELMRDLLGRSGRSPTGYLVIGDAPGRSTSYYTYGMAARQGAPKSAAVPHLRR
jgi:capsular exopolysaccharide synthesis family protein